MSTTIQYYSPTLEHAVQWFKSSMFYKDAAQQSISSFEYFNSSGATMLKQVANEHTFPDGSTNGYVYQIWALPQKYPQTGVELTCFFKRYGSPSEYERSLSLRLQKGMVCPIKPPTKFEDMKEDGYYIPYLIGNTSSRGVKGRVGLNTKAVKVYKSIDESSYWEGYEPSTVVSVEDLAGSVASMLKLIDKGIKNHNKIYAEIDTCYTNLAVRKSKTLEAKVNSEASQKKAIADLQLLIQRLEEVDHV